MNRLFTMALEIKPLTDPTLRILGPACTVKVFPGDNLMVHKSLDIARPGDVVVADASFSAGWVATHIPAMRAARDFLFARAFQLMVEDGSLAVLRMAASQVSRAAGSISSVAASSRSSSSACR